MGFPNTFYGIHIKKFAQIIAIIGIILSCLSFLLNIFSWNYFPMTISLLIAFILVLVGLNKVKPGYLLAANIILGSNIFIDFLLLISALYIGITVPPEFIDNFDEKESYIESGNVEIRKISLYFFLPIPKR
uniref:Uncharacterized protein n=1 Tax=Panagrolaimus sp. PS1159 TaxID=55785 RepID=A0AC35GV18_9BILA